MSRRDQESPVPPEGDEPPLSGRSRLAETLVRQPGRPRPSQGNDSPDSRRFRQRFSAEDVIAVGGMGQLRRHRDKHLRRDVVAKGLRPDLQDDGTARLRLVREARIQAGLQHPCIVPVYDVGNVERRDVFFLMAHIGGMTLQEVIAGLRDRDARIARRFSRRRLLEAFCRVCLAIAYAHERGVVHRDLKPENIMLGEYGEVYVLDWGIAKQLDEGEGRAAFEQRAAALAALPHLHGDEDDGDGGDDIETEAGTALGTLEYMAPEQYLAAKQPDERSDIYALGAILYEILSLSWFRQAPSRGELARVVWRETMKPIDRRPIDGVSAELDSVWRKATATRPADRFQTARELHDAIIGHLDEEREKQRARDVAMEHARAAALEIADEDASPEEAEARRGRALRRLGQALAVDPSLGDALQALVNDLLDHPAVASAEVREEMRRTEHETAVRSYGLSAVMFACWFVFLVLGNQLMGVLDRPLMLVTGSLVLVLCLYNAWLWRTRRHARGHMLALVALGFAAVGLTSAVLGPLMLLPSLATSMFAAFAVTMRSALLTRRIVMGLSVASVAVPSLLQLIGEMPPSYVFEGGNMVVVPRLVALPPNVTPVILTAATLVTIVLSNLHLSQVVQALVRSERSALTQAQRLRQLLPARSSNLPTEPTR